MVRKAMVAAAALLAGCGAVHAQGDAATRRFAVRGFDRVALRGADNVVVRVGAAESVTAAGPADELDRLEILVKDGELRIGRKRDSWRMGWSDRPPVVVTVTLPRLRAAAVAGSGDMQVDRVQAASFQASVAGSGDLRIGTLTADAASVSIAGSGDATVGGRATSLDVSVAGSGNLDANGLRAERGQDQRRGLRRRARPGGGRGGRVDRRIGRRHARRQASLPRQQDGLGRGQVRLTALLAASLLAGPAAAAERGYTVTSFDRVKVEGPFLVTVASGKAPAARASGSASAIERVQVRVEGRTLIVRPNVSAWGGYPGRQDAPAQIAVSTQAIHTAMLIGSGRVEIDRIRGAKAALTVEGSGRIGIAALDVDVASLAVLGSGGIEAAGRAKKADVIVRGAAEIAAPDLIASDLNLVAESAGRVTLSAARSALVTATGVGPVDVLGTAACEVKKVGAGPVSCGRWRGE